MTGRLSRSHISFKGAPSWVKMESFVMLIAKMIAMASNMSFFTKVSAAHTYTLYTKKGQAKVDIEKLSGIVFCCLL